MSPHEENKISIEYKIQRRVDLLFRLDLTLNLILIFNFALTPIHDRYMPAWKGKYASLDYALTNKMSNVKGHLLNLLWLKTFKMIKRKCKITHAQRKDSVEYFPEWHTHIVTSVALNVYVLCLYVTIYIYKENMMSKYDIWQSYLSICYKIINFLCQQLRSN